MCTKKVQLFLFFNVFSVFDVFFLSLTIKYLHKGKTTKPNFAWNYPSAMNNYSVKKNITKKRKASGISQTEMADKLGLSRTAYRNIEMGDTRLISEKVEEIARLLDVSSEELVLGYKPSENIAMRVSDIEQGFEEEKTELIRKYEAEMKRLENTIDTLNSFITALRETIGTKDEMIAMLKKKLADDGNNE